ncbi:MAG: MBL fold metallo-hydrolase [Flavobacteriaceae bacterium]|jgi:glyoxylase-like metal-dependent hydrolase (beta-lactamase superfamily II)/rhodanese-related sulfurtransferase|nr:MBL fold metallo-hydrolase [Flavobacteriaceae bacterium]
MKIEQLYTKCLSQGSYYIISDNEVAIIDPLRETNQYIEKAKKDNAKIKYVFETHFHADFVSGHVDLANKTNSTIIYGPNAETEYPIYNAKDNEEFKLGKITIKALHTPGHTLESTTYLVIDENGNNHSIFTGDTLFIGDVGRPDLAVSKNLTEIDLAGMLYDSLRNKIMNLEGHVLVYPAHGAGSACGKNLSKETFSTLENQKKTNYALRENITKEMFVKELLEGMPPPPQYFQKNALLNKSGYKPLDKVITQSNKSIDIGQFCKLANSSEYLVLDVRHQKDFINGHIPNSLFIGLNGTFAPWVGTLIENIDQKILLISEKGKEIEAITRLSRVGYDNCIGYLEGGFKSWKDKYGEEKVESISSQSFVDNLKLNSIKIIDVRRESEYINKHIEGANNIPLSLLSNELKNISDTQDNYYIHCAGGYRSVIAISILKAKGIHNVIDVAGGFGSILKTDLNQGCYNSLLTCNI